LHFAPNSGLIKDKTLHFQNFNRKQQLIVELETLLIRPFRLFLPVLSRKKFPLNSNSQITSPLPNLLFGVQKIIFIFANKIDICQRKFFYVEI